MQRRATCASRAPGQPEQGPERRLAGKTGPLREEPRLRTPLAQELALGVAPREPVDPRDAPGVTVAEEVSKGLGEVGRLPAHPLVEGMPDTARRPADLGDPDPGVVVGAGHLLTDPPHLVAHTRDRRRVRMDRDGVEPTLDPPYAVEPVQVAPRGVSGIRPGAGVAEHSPEDDVCAGVA